YTNFEIKQQIQETFLYEDKMLVTCVGIALFMWFPGALNAPRNEQSCLHPRLNDGFVVPKRKTYPSGSHLTYTCHEGLKPAVKGWWQQVTCQDGRWSHEPQCIHETACLPLHIPNGRYSVNSQGWYNGGDTISVTCDEGYEPKDLITDASCSEGQWTAVPVRQKPILKCTEPPKIPHAVITDLGYQDEFPPNATVHYKCEHGFSLEGGEATKTAHCSYGRWSDTPNCSKSDSSGDAPIDSIYNFCLLCQLFAQPFFFLSSLPLWNQTHNRSWTVEETNVFFLKYGCSTNFTLVGSDVVVCHSNGSWSTLPTCSGMCVQISTFVYYDTQWCVTVMALGPPSHLFRYVCTN
uniref:Sushi domain-containing protein n=1 Tax=Sphaeramia orbicularis TaxID=375764 RepID=A0A673AGZ6_9TELE